MTVSIEQVRSHARQARLRFADSAAELGAVLVDLGEYVEADAVLRQAVGGYESIAGADRSRLAAALTALGATCVARGRLAEAEGLYRQALQIIEQSEGASHEPAAGR